MRALLVQREVDVRDRAFSGVGHLEQFRGLEPEHAGNDVRREHLLADVELGGDIIIELAGEADLVLGAGELFLKLFHIFIRLQGRIRFGEGEELAERFGFTRAALWKKISILRSEGHPIEAITNRGYRMASRDREFEQEIREELQKNHIDDVFAVSVTDTTPSTNLLARAAGAREAGLREAGARIANPGEEKKIGVFIALQQSAGRGRRGRTWISNTQDGLWFSFLLRPKVEPRTASTLTLLFGLCILKAIQSICGIPAGIKWPNDIISLLRQSGYRCWGVGKSSLREVDGVTDETSETNYLFLHSAHRREIAGAADGSLFAPV